MFSFSHSYVISNNNVLNRIKLYGMCSLGVLCEKKNLSTSCRVLLFFFLEQNFNEIVFDFWIVQGSRIFYTRQNMLI